jgi:hypothetical protein
MVLVRASLATFAAEGRIIWQSSGRGCGAVAVVGEYEILP